MHEPGDLSRHFWLTQGMARTVGADLNGALRDGSLRRSEYSEMIALCCLCPEARTCMEWLGRMGAGADAPPLFCRLRAQIVALKDC